MSSILKALKKLEDDKASRRADDLKIDSEILRSDNSPRFSSTGVLLASLLLLAGGSGVTYMYMKPDKVSEPASYKVPAKTRQLDQLSKPMASDIKTELLPAAVVVVPANQNKTLKSAPIKAHLSPSPISTKSPVASQKPAKTVVASKPADQVKAANPAPPSTSPRAVPTLRVNGIATQNSIEDSLAIVNGIAVSKGSIIEGVTVVEVQKDRVLFLRNGEKFEIQLGQSNQ